MSAKDRVIIDGERVTLCDDVAQTIATLGRREHNERRSEREIAYALEIRSLWNWLRDIADLQLPPRSDMANADRAQHIIALLRNMAHYAATGQQF